jgi:hypothetical protein
VSTAPRPGKVGGAPLRQATPCDTGPRPARPPVLAGRVLSPLLHRDATGETQAQHEEWAPSGGDEDATSVRHRCGPASTARPRRRACRRDIARHSTVGNRQGSSSPRAGRRMRLHRSPTKPSTRLKRAGRPTSPVLFERGHRCPAARGRKVRPEHAKRREVLPAMRRHRQGWTHRSSDLVVPFLLGQR